MQIVNTILLIMAGFLQPGKFTQAGEDRFPLLIEVTNVSVKKGPVMMALFQSPEGFPMDASKAVYREKVQAENGKAFVRVDGLKTGTYAVALFHDTNGDGQLNLNFVGVPKEGYAVSNNVRNRFSAPKFSQASFRHDHETRLQIQLRY